MVVDLQQQAVTGAVALAELVCPTDKHQVLLVESQTDQPTLAVAVVARLRVELRRAEQVGALES
jgi:hypothetical protein